MSFGPGDIPGSERRAARIEEKKRLLTWLQGRQGGNDTGTMENYLCLRSILERAGWRMTPSPDNKPGRWSKPDLDHRNLAIIQAASIEVARQIEQDTEAHLKLAGVIVRRE